MELVEMTKWFGRLVLSYNPADIYLFKVNNENGRKVSKICPKLTINTLERPQWRRSSVFMVNFEQVLHIGLVLQLLIF